MASQGRALLPGRWSTWIAALPPVVLTAGFTLAALDIRWHPHGTPLAIVALAVPLVVLLVGGGVALIRRLPDAGVPWAGASLFALIFVLLAVVDLMHPGRPTRHALYVAGVAMTYGAEAALILVAARRGWRRVGLLSFGLGSTPPLFHAFVLATVPGGWPGALPLLPALGLLLGGLLFLWARGPDGIRIAAGAVLLLVDLPCCSLYYRLLVDEVGSSFSREAPEQALRVLAAPLLALALAALARHLPRVRRWVEA